MAQRLGRGIALLFHDRCTRRGWVVSSTSRPHFTPGKDPVPFYRRLGGPQGRSGRAENLVPTGIRSRTVQPAVSLYTDWATRPMNSPKKLRVNTVFDVWTHEAKIIKNYSFVYFLVLHGWDTWYKILLDGHRRRLLEKRALKNIFWGETVEIKRGWGKLHNEELCESYSFRNITKLIKGWKVGLAGHVARIGSNKNPPKSKLVTDRRR